MMILQSIGNVACSFDVVHALSKVQDISLSLSLAREIDREPGHLLQQYAEEDLLDW